MQHQSDAQLLRDYAAHGSEPAIAALVARHTDLVYSAAFRQTGSPDLAREIAQNVFTDLARKARALAGQLTPDASLAGWLYRGTRYATLTRLRNDRRRASHERQFMEHFNPAAAPNSDWELVAPVLDEAMAELNDADREAVLLRFFQNQNFPAVARALGVSEAAAQKRVSRAVERLREFLAQRGVTVGASGLVVIISTNAVLMAPTGLSAAITAAAVITGKTVSTTTMFGLTKALAMTTLQKSLVAATILLAIGATTVITNRASETHSAMLFDGSKVTIRQMSFGKEHRFVDGSLWQKLLGKFSTNITAALGGKTRTDVTKEDTLVLWVEWHDRTNKAPFPQWIRVVDSNGLASFTKTVVHSIYHSNDTMLAAFHLKSFPRREPKLLIELYAAHPTQPNTQQHIADFRVNNPRFTAKSVPDDRTWPQTQEFHGEQFTLLGINTGLSATGTLAGMYANNQWTELIFRIGTNEPAQRTTNANEVGDWSIKSIELRDTLGNFVQERNPQGHYLPLGQQYMMRRDDGIALIPGAIWPNEFWNVRAEFQRNLTPSLDFSHRWTAAVSVPAIGERTSIEQTGHVEGCVIELRSLENFASSPPMLTVRFRGQDPSYQLRVLSVRDQRDSNIVHWFRGATKTDRRFELRTAPESTELQVTFAITHSVIVELGGQSSILRTNVARWMNKFY